MIRTFILFSILVVRFSPFALSEPADIEGEVRVGAPPPTIAIIPTRVDGDFPRSAEIAETIRDVLRQDLTWSLAFDVFDDRPLLERQLEEDRRSGAIDYGAWNNMGIHYLVETAVRGPAPDTLEVDLMLHDIRDQRVTEAKQTKDFAEGQLRQVVHRYSDLVVQRCTGRIGIAQTKIAFVNHKPTRRLKEIFLIDYDGWKDSLVQVTEHNSTTLFPAWSPDGECLAYTSYYKGWPDSFIHYLYRRTGTKVLPLAEKPGNNVTPVWNPVDADWLAISLSFKGNPDIYLIRRDGRYTRQLTTNKSIEEAPCFSPNGQEIAFTSDRTGYPQIYVMNSDGSNVRPLVRMPGYSCDTAQWSPVPVGGPYGTHRIAFRAYPIGGALGDIYSVNADGTDLVNLTQLQDRYDNSNPSWSPDGQYIAFSSTRAGGKAEIWIMRSHGGDPRRVTYVPGQNLSPAWSPAPDM